MAQLTKGQTKSEISSEKEARKTHAPKRALCTECTAFDAAVKLGRTALIIILFTATHVRTLARTFRLPPHTARAATVPYGPYRHSQYPPTLPSALCPLGSRINRRGTIGL